jgi:hypothetical protein
MVQLGFSAVQPPHLDRRRPGAAQAVAAGRLLQGDAQGSYQGPHGVPRPQPAGRQLHRLRVVRRHPARVRAVR